MRSLLLAALLLAAPADARRLHPEDAYNRTWCKENGGKPEQVLDDRSRVDCLTLGYAIEADFADKWPEAVGQATHYARMTGRLPGLLLIVEGEDQCRRIVQARAALARLRFHHQEYGLVPLRLWVIGEVCGAD